MKKISRNHQVTLYTGAGTLLEEIEHVTSNVRTIPFISRSVTSSFSCSIPISPAVLESTSMYLSAYLQGTFNSIEQDEDIVVTFFHLDNVLISRTLDIPTLHHFWGAPTIDLQTKLMVRLAQPNTLLANSEETAFRLRHYIGESVDGIVYPGVDLEQFTPDSDPAFDETRTVILYVGRLDPAKGLRELLDAFYQVTEDELLYLVGEGPAEYELRKQARSYGIQDSVNFVGSIPHDQIQRYYAACDIFCLPSRYESFGLVNLEAMACGKPVITSKLPATKEYISNGENGLLFSPSKTDELANGLSKLIQSEALREILGSNGRKTAEKYSWDHQAAKLEEYINNTVCEFNN